MLKYIFIFFIFLLVPVFVSAQVVISEVMYDIEGSDTGHEWVEVTNTSANAINIVDWKFFEEGSNHGLTLITGDANVPSGSSVILVDNSDKFFVDNSQFQELFLTVLFL